MLLSLSSIAMNVWNERDNGMWMFEKKEKIGERM